MYIFCHRLFSGFRIAYWGKFWASLSHLVLVEELLIVTFAFLIIIIDWFEEGETWFAFFFDKSIYDFIFLILTNFILQLSRTFLHTLWFLKFRHLPLWVARRADFGDKHVLRCACVKLLHIKWYFGTFDCNWALVPIELLLSIVELLNWRRHWGIYRGLHNYLLSNRPSTAVFTSMKLKFGSF